MLSVILNSKKAFAYLLDKGANVKILDKEKMDLITIAATNACHACVRLIENKERQNQVTPLINFASTYTAPDPIWLPYSTVKKAAVTKKKTVNRDPNAIVIQGNITSLPTYKEMPQILPLKENDEPNMVIRSR